VPATAAATPTAHARLPLPSARCAGGLEILDQRRAALDPVAVVAIEDAVDGADLGVMDVSAHHTIDAATACFARDGLLVVVDELDGVLDLVFEIGRQRPVG